MKKAISFSLILLLFALGGILVFLAFASRPGVPESVFPNQAIIEFHFASKSPDPPRPLTVVTYNIGYASGEKNNQGSVLTKKEVEENLKSMIDKLLPLKPDLVFLQEVDFFSHRTFEVNQMEALAKGLGLPFAAYGITWNKRYLPWPYWPPQRQFGKVVSGQVVLSRYPLADQTIHTLPKPADNPFWYNWFYLNRIIQSLKVQVGETSIPILNVHLEAFSESNKSTQLQELAQWIHPYLPGPVLLAGDFNLIWQGRGEPPEDATQHHRLLENFIQTTGLKLASPDTSPLTFPSWQPVKQIDLIFYSPQFKLQSAETLNGLTASDHLPVEAVLQL